MHRIRRIEAAEALQVLRQQPITVAAGMAAAASAHIRDSCQQPFGRGDWARLINTRRRGHEIV
jgi:hypothetical protein